MKEPNTFDYTKIYLSKNNLKNNFAIYLPWNLILKIESHYLELVRIHQQLVTSKFSKNYQTSILLLSLMQVTIPKKSIKKIFSLEIFY